MQTRRQSLIETIAGVAIGFAISITENASIAVIFTTASIVRGYGVRRLFNWIWRAKA